MPRCIGPKAGSYKGTEPSPKGYGYCARNCAELSTAKGRDGQVWIVWNGKWVHYSDSVKKQVADNHLKVTRLKVSIPRAKPTQKRRPAKKPGKSSKTKAKPRPRKKIKR
jgi:hypothetical protein